MRTCSPTDAPASSSDAATLLPSPTYTSWRPARASMPPQCSASAIRSASAWQGCSASESALMTGTRDAAARSSSSEWSNTRATIASTYRSRVWATSRGTSRDPSPTSSPTSTTGVAPRREIPTSKLTRVRRLGFWKMSATERPASGWTPAPGALPALSAPARASTSAMPGGIQVGDGQEPAGRRGGWDGHLRLGWRVLHGYAILAPASAC